MAQKDADTDLEAYHFYENEWDDFDDLHDTFEWEVPTSFNIAEYFCTRWADNKGRVALFAEGEDGRSSTYTYWQLENLSNQFANLVTDHGVEEGDRVGVVSPQKPETLISLFGLWKLGAVPVPLSTLFGPDAIEYRLSDCRAVGCVADAENIDALRERREHVESLQFTLAVGADADDDELDFWNAIEKQPRTFDTVRTAAEDDALILYTSGTTGQPKGVVHGHRVMLGFLPGFLTILCNNELREGDLFWTPTEWAWVAFFAIAFPGMFYGKPIFADSAQFDPERTLALIEEYGITHILLTPTIARMMMQVDDPTDRWNLHHVRGIWSGGEEPTETVLEWISNTFENSSPHVAYGQTEAVFAGECTALMPARRGTVGKAVPGSEATIVDPDTAEPTVPRGSVGEIAVRYGGNPLCFKEYWEEPEKTDRKVRNGWLLTEDLGSMDEDGYITFLGRKDDVIISSGYRMGPEEIEDAIATHDAVLDAGVIGVPDDIRGEVPKAFLELAEGYAPSEELESELQEFVKEKLAKYEYPREVEFVDELPRTTTGKIQRYELRKREGLETRTR